MTKDINRLKVVLAEKKRNEPTNGSPNNWAKILQPSQSGVPTPYSRMSRHWWRLPNV